MATGASHLWLANLKHHKISQMVWGLEHRRYKDRLRNLGWFSWAEARWKGNQLVVLTIFMCKRLMMTAICSKAALNTNRLHLFQWTVWATSQDDAATTWLCFCFFPQIHTSVFISRCWAEVAGMPFEGLSSVNCLLFCQIRSWIISWGLVCSKYNSFLC